MNWQESDFHYHADKFLESIFEQLEQQDEAGLCELDIGGGILSIEVQDGRQFILSKHAPSRQIWLSSPLTGGLHFSPVDEGRDWKLPDGRHLSIVLSEEISQATGADFYISVMA